MVFDDAGSCNLLAGMHVGLGKAPEKLELRIAVNAYDGGSITLLHFRISKAIFWYLVGHEVGTVERYE